jgi:3-oxoacid CoA-transferase B subunit/3-oxoacid CoA-transferase A subunit
VVSNNCGVDGFGLGVLLEDRQIRKMIASYVGENAEFERQLLSGELEVELTPQGTLAEKMRAGGAGIPAFFTATGYGTPVADGKEVREFKGRKYILEESITGDFAIVKGWKADHYGNVVYRNTAQNFNPLAATAGKITVVEVEEIVEPGELLPARSTPRASTSTGSSSAPSRSASKSAPSRPERHPPEQQRDPDHGTDPRTDGSTRRPRTEGRLLREPGHRHPDPGGQLRTRRHGSDAAIGKRPARHGRIPDRSTIDADMINAGKQTVTARRGASIFDSAQSFAMIRGGHVDLTVLGAFEVDVQGNIASWMIPGKLVKGMGGAMDLVAGADNIIVTMTHASKDGESKLLPQCSLPLTGAGCIRKVLTDLAYLEIEDGAFILRETAPGERRGNHRENRRQADRAG